MYTLCVQVAGCTIDASAKIYAGRVDSIYNDAHKVLGGLVHSDQPPGKGLYRELLVLLRILLTQTSKKATKENSSNSRVGNEPRR